jgi:hypothetical protein
MLYDTIINSQPKPERASAFWLLDEEFKRNMRKAQRFVRHYEVAA